MASPLIDIADLDVFYEDAQALWNINFQIFEGEIFSIIGSNGAGKSTILRTMAGLLKPATGRIDFLGSRVDGSSTDVMVDLGVSLVPEGRGLFSRLTVLENLKLGAFTRRARSSMDQTLDYIYDLFPVVKKRRNQLAGKMSGGEQQMVAIGRALMSQPRLLMLDEPSLGLAPLVVKSMFQVFTALNRRGVTILLVEQNIHQALQIADRALVLKTGRITMEGTGAALLADPEIQQAYMGSLR